jgi:hypothetical protein
VKEFQLTSDTDRRVKLIYQGKIRIGSVDSRIVGMDSAKFEAGPEFKHTETDVSALAEICTRVAPWLRVYVGGRLWNKRTVGEDISTVRNHREPIDGFYECEVAGIACRTTGCSATGRMAG